jgi:hypothetical protein
LGVKKARMDERLRKKKGCPFRYSFIIFADNNLPLRIQVQSTIIFADK